MVPIKIQLDNDDHYDGQCSCEKITVHDTGNGTDSDEANANWFCTGSRNASANYFVDDDSITMLVKPTDGSYHCGDGHGKYGITNRNSIGVEQCRKNGVVTAKTEANTVDLVRMLMATYHIPLVEVGRHWDASRKNCPASFNLDGKWTRWFAFKSKLVTAPIVKPALNTTHYRVRKTWADVTSQIGAFTDLANAKVCADAHKEYEVYDINGIQVYPVRIIPVGSKYGIVTASVLNVRSSMDVMVDNKIGQLVKGQKIKIDKLVGEWYSIYFGDHGGYVSAKFINLI